MKTNRVAKLFTVGYEGVDADAFFETLLAHEIGLLADLRELPLSRKPGFSKNALVARCVRQRLEYRHFVELGCPRKIRHDYRRDGDWPRYARRFRTHLSHQSDSLGALAKLVGSARVCLMCFERDAARCHRRYVADAVISLLGSGAAEISNLAVA